MRIPRARLVAVQSFSVPADFNLHLPCFEKQVADQPDGIMRSSLPVVHTACGFAVRYRLRLDVESLRNENENTACAAAFYARGDPIWLPHPSRRWWPFIFGLHQTAGQTSRHRSHRAEGRMKGRQTNHSHQKSKNVSPSAKLISPTPDETSPHTITHHHFSRLHRCFALALDRVLLSIIESKTELTQEVCVNETPGS